MSKISIKTDFADGEKLFAQELNNNFLVIQAGINANEENLQEVIDQAIIELDKQLEEITADRGWDWNGGNRVTFYKGNAQAIENREIINGQLLYNTETGETALDDNGERINTGSGNVVVVSDTQPTNEATKDWIKPVIINGTETAEEYFKNSNNQWKKILNQPSGDTLPIGSIAQFGGETVPTNWLFCNGQAVSRETYSELFAVIGTTYGEGNGSTTFNLPDFSSRSPMGVGTGTDGTNSETTTLGQEKGEYKHTLTENEIPPLTTYSPSQTSGGNMAYLSNWSGYNGSGLGTTPITKTKTTNAKAHNTTHPVLGVNYIIKAKQSIGILGTVSEDITDTNNNAVPTCETVKEYVDKKQTYSTDEIVIGTYLGKPLYRKVITGYLNDAPFNHGIKNAVFHKVNGIYLTTAGLTFPIPSTRPNYQEYQIGMWVSKTQVIFEKGNAVGNYYTEILLEYTKTTD